MFALIFINSVYTNFSSFRIRCQEIHNLDSSYQDFLFDIHFHKFRRIRMDWSIVFGANWSTLVNWLADNINDSTECLGTNRNFDGIACVNNFLSANQSFSSIHSYRSHNIVTCLKKYYYHSRWTIISWTRITKHFDEFKFTFLGFNAKLAE